MGFVGLLLVVCACGRFNFEASGDAQIEALAITSPPENAEVQGTTILTGTCVSGLPISVAGAGLVSPDATSCDAGAFAVTIAFTDGDGTKPVTVTQGAATVARTFVRVTHAMLRSGSIGTKGTAGFMVDCDLVIAAPPGLAPGDLVLGMIYTDGGGPGASVATPGFTRAMLAAGAYVVFWKIADAIEPVTYEFRIAAGTDAAATCESAGVLTAWSGVDVANPIVAESGVVDSNDTIVVAPQVTAPSPAILVGMWGSNGPASGFTIADLPMAIQARSLDDNANVLIAFDAVAAGATGARTATLTETRAAAAGLFIINGKP